MECEKIIESLQNPLLAKNFFFISKLYFLLAYKKDDSSISYYVSEIWRDTSDC